MSRPSGTTGEPEVGSDCPKLKGRATPDTLKYVSRQSPPPPSPPNDVRRRPSRDPADTAAGSGASRS